jgi:hypothetical protein
MYLSIPWNLSIDEPFSSRGSLFGDRGAVFIWHLGDRGAVLTIAEMDSLFTSTGNKLTCGRIHIVYSSVIICVVVMEISSGDAFYSETQR